ncbi:helix-turn-helix domain-containing protein [Nitratireductor aquimarinus]|uniref:Helix-turn-helix domain-containing protein n=1 Tax=Nitratireductor aquimarinus TaxID=889300 RepID=A0ABU4ANL6_9HYPH|nr:MULTISPECIES: helix-turn-helix domain-containing protein [Alphaproteobacteria]MBY6020491.1 helix-turn-helix domain-containing protein [Nitratireductor sp. DP7N14-4]MBN7755705.1 helix-turn-helix domain-containing protein [Nitratireductor aquimarinus]MBN7763215.1 helix-turn-helix domain-containing protein [Nitratireductor aquibiodomus]MBN7776071.1 helix-turn-helix domain-containing protein [Nitratireductor pacificus]MBN7780735.1 helix-turn-helix domain-containing protein [Nitratireductor paci
MFAQAATAHAPTAPFRGHQRLAEARPAPASFSPDQPHQIAFFEANEEVYAQGERANALYQVEFGAVRLYRLLSDGRRQISAFHVAGEVFGFEADGHHHFFAEAVGPAGIRVFRQPANEGNWRQTLDAALGALVRAQEHLLVIGRQNAAERVAAFLLDMMERQDNAREVQLPMSRTDIGDYLGLTIETVSRTFSKFKSKGLVRLANTRTVEVVDEAALRAMCA